MRKLLLVLSMLACTFGIVKAQNSKDFAYPNKKAWLISTKPQTLLFGFNLGIERVFSPKFSWYTETTSHFHSAFQKILVYQSTALSTSLRWHCVGRFGKSFYVEPKLVAGLFYNETLVENKPYYAGGGLSVGLMYPLFKKNKHWYYFYDAGVKFCIPFGYRANSLIGDPNSGAIYAFLSPASLIDFSVGISYRF